MGPGRPISETNSFSMPSRPSPLCCISLYFVWFACVRDAHSLGQGREIWQQPRPDPLARDQAFLHDTFPPGFLWGAGTSAFQTEGSWDKDGKSPSIWDAFTHASDRGNEASARVASDSYARWEEDVQALEYLGARSYSFSLSWPRLFPHGDPGGRPSAAAVEHYSRLIDALLARRIQPMVTLHHWDLPQALQDAHGGWRNHTLVGLFEEYAAFCFRTFGGRVKHWLTMHNPYLLAVQGYGTGVHAPGEAGGPAASLLVAHNLIRAHARAWHTYDTHFRPTQRGKVSIVLGSHWVEPQRGPSVAINIDLCQQSMEAVLGWFANPIFGDGDYPASLKVKHGRLMPTFSTDEKLWVRGTADFFALSFGPNNLRLGQNLVHYGQSMTPDLRRVLRWVQLEYGDPAVLLAEGGWFSEARDGREDTVNMYLMKRFINQVLRAIRFDGSRVFGYTAWSLVDGFEWNYGYTVRRGLFFIDFTRPDRTRTPKTTAHYYKRIIADNGFPRAEGFGEITGRFPCDFHWGIADSTLQVHFFPFSPQFTDPRVYRWNVTGDGSLHPVPGVKLHTSQPQCTDYLAIRDHLRLFASTGASHYRFALNWSLILPQGGVSNINTEALRYYRCVLTELERLALEPVVILYYPSSRAPHGLPAPLHAAGGWLNRSTVEAFQDYAALCYRELGSWVPYWITINEPNRLADFYPSGAERHQAAHHLLLAHAKAWRLHLRESSIRPGAKVSLALHADWAEPTDPFLASHSAAAQRFLLFELGRFLDPLLGAEHEEMQDRGDYPQEMRAYLEERVRETGRPESPLPSFTDSEKQELRGALSFIALNHFTTRLVSPAPSDARQRHGANHDCLIFSDPTWPTSALGQALVPWGLRRILGWVSQRYGASLPILVTASGVDDQAPLDDRLRQEYLRSYLQEALKARREDGVNVQGFYVWKLQDGHVPQFGLFSSTHHKSKAKASVAMYKDIIARGGFPEDNATRSCRPPEPQQPCSVCAWMLRNKALLVFGGCLLVTAVMLAALVVFVIITRGNQIGRGGRGAGRVGRRRRRREGVLVCSCPPVVKR